MEWSWAGSIAEVRQRRRHAQRLTGLQLAAVRYCEIDTVSWDSPGAHEGIWLREVPLVGEAALVDANTAVWDVSRAGRWDGFIGHEISDVQLHYRPWAPGDGYWCNRVTITVRGSDIQFLGGQAEAQTLAPSADNIAVLFPPAPLPEWQRYDDGV